MPSPILQHLADRVLVIDGAMGTQVQECDLSVDGDYRGCENCTEILVASRPGLIRDIHAAYFDAGADAVETNTFGAMPHVLREFDLQKDAYDLSRSAAQIAREAAASFSTPDRPRFVLGAMGPGTKLATLGQISRDELIASYRECARGLLDGGIDAFLLETCQDPLQIKSALTAIDLVRTEAGKTAADLPTLINITIETTGTMLVGSSIEAAVRMLLGYPVVSLGLNCATGPAEMGEPLSYLSKHWPERIACVPNAGLPILVEGRTEYPLGPKPFAEALKKYIDQYGLSVVGGCCGTTPDHIRALAEAVHGHPAPTRTVSLPPAGCASLYAPTDYRQDNSFLIVGERCNASGSRAFKRLLEAEDWDGIVALARQQAREGSHVLDVNVDYAGRDNVSDMAEVVSRLVRQVDLPLMIDSTQLATIEAGLKHAPGKCIINSANFEDGEEKFDAFCALAKTYNAGLVIGTIDEDPEAAMARTADRKLAIASRAIDRAVNHHGLKVEDLFIDPLVLPVSTGMDADRRSALELVEGTKRIAEKYPTVQITCGLSNCSFGLKPAARVVLNSVFLHELTDAGMTSAIVHASKILPLNKIDDEHQAVALDLIYDRREKGDPLQRLIELFKDVEDAAHTGPSLADLPLNERLRKHIIDGEKEGLPESIDEALGVMPPLDIINEHLLDGMKTVGELFGSGQMQLPFVLQSAEVMKMAVARLEPHMERVEGQTKGSIVLATVKGDVHDIGKNLVDIILTNNGYTVYNIGIKQTLPQILDKWRETKADAIGLSGLLVKSVNVMEDNLREMNEQGITVPVILGGAALTRTYAEGHLRSAYKGALLYGKDAFEGLRVMDKVSTGKVNDLIAEIEDRQTKRAELIARTADAKQDAKPSGKTDGKSDANSEPETAPAAPAPTSSNGTATLTRVRSEVARDTLLPEPPFWGTRVVESLPLEPIFAHINPTALFSVQWQMKRGSMSKADHERQLKEVAQPVFDRLKREAIEQNILHPRVVYGYFPVSSEGDDLIVFDPTDHDREIERFSFPRQSAERGRGRQLCIADFFRDTDECRTVGRRDVLGMSCVTVGETVSQRCKQLFDQDKYQEYLYLHGLGVESAEGLAELWHKRMRQELGFGNEDAPKITDLFSQKYRGSRYSFGYPACPNMADQDTLWRLLDPTRIGCTLTENHQIDPEQSTSAIVVHHPEAKYFNA